MQLILLRHGIAVDRSAGLADVDRPLTDLGIKRTRQAIAGLARLIDRPGIILTSPILRAVQTADIAAAALAAPVQAIDALAHGSPEPVIDALSDRAEGVILVVGHEPTLSAVVEILCFGQATSTVTLKKAGCAGITAPSRLRPGCGSLQWLATPKMLRAIAD